MTELISFNALKDSVMKKLFSLVFLTCMAGCGDEESLGDARAKLANGTVPNIETSPQTMHGLGDSKPQFAVPSEDINGHPPHSLRDHVIPLFLLARRNPKRLLTCQRSPKPSSELTTM